MNNSERDDQSIDFPFQTYLICDQTFTAIFQDQKRKKTAGTVIAINIQIYQDQTKQQYFCLCQFITANFMK